ncbi:MAG: livG [Acidimicrobiales bacterium]|jgi:branched-chain amino acid transport system ATP-binding protein|nr:livG [Acidimicrobiales bacterium]
MVPSECHATRGRDVRASPIRARQVVIAWLVLYFPWLPGFPLNRWLPSVPFSYIVDANLAGEYALVAFSLVILTGWVGQISLGQGSFVGIGAFTTGILARRFGIPFPLNLPLVALVSAGVASMLGLVALRVRGLYLAVATLIFAWMCDAYLFSQQWFVGKAAASSIPNTVIGHPGTMTTFDLSNQRVFYLVVVTAVATAWYAAVNLRDSKTGRAFFAIRGSEVAAVSLAVDVTRYKLLAFAVSGALAGIAGNLIMTNVRVATPVVFQFTVSLFYLSIAVVGGINSLGGGVAAGILFAALTEVFYRVKTLTGWRDIVAVALLLGVLLGYPGGLGALGTATERRFRGVTKWLSRLIERPIAKGSAMLRRRRPSDGQIGTVTPVPVEVGDRRQRRPGTSRAAAFAQRLPTRRSRSPVIRRSIDLSVLGRTALEPNSAVDVREMTAGDDVETARASWRTMVIPPYPLAPDRSERPPVLEAEHVVVRFGGLTAVNDVTVVVREHEIVGLIGPNGAGKTTTFNAIAGLNEPTSGTVRLFGVDATKFPVHVRAQMGVGRTFQLIQLFPQLTVFDNLLVATHVHNPTGIFSHLALMSRAIASEADARARVRLVVEMLGLEEVASRPTAGLPFGILRQVEIARALVTEAPLLMLDEPASGLDNAETDELAQLLYFVRSQLGVSILLIEHDVRMVTAVSDYMYVINRGEPLADGTPSEIQSNPEVIAAYLGQAEEPKSAANDSNGRHISSDASIAGVEQGAEVLT